ncbi:LysR family transcriptional regulator [Azospirillum rugosum]|uniref:DNA-binding transcriptional LysR family regulator n=1 Tax=Azospirillum rugosum TaxID=416170 RepID=A0ABS4SWS8_9PROT|nr:LysR family transcriptional regulator [Azospirillum rugosum]MBP2297000.1 DNA-binding transcriptional LysR family regulator [Azospirillum rugosum]MDQ0530632.1 DNA-binding transcriptional LysR family regulator [Azospirillum rugosum]
MTDLSLGDLKALSAVAAHRSFRAAAAELGMSPSALSHAVAGLERRLGVRLFNRTTRSVSLTEAGENFLARVRPAMREIADAVETVNRFRDTPAGLLRLNTSEGGAERVLPIVLDFMATYPDMRVDLVSEGRMVDIVEAGFDAGLRLAEAVPQDMVAVPLNMPEAFAVVAAPECFATRPPPRVPADLFAHDCIRTRMPSGAIHRWEFERQGEEIRIDPPGRLTLGSHELSLRAALAGAGLAYVTERAARADLAAGRLVRVLADWTPPFPGLCLYYPRQRLPSAGLRAFIAHVQRHGQRHAQLHA